MKKRIAALLMSIVIAVMFAACSSGADKQDELADGQDTQASAEELNDTQKNYQGTWYGTFAYNYTDDKNTVGDDVVANISFKGAKGSAATLEVKSFGNSSPIFSAELDILPDGGWSASQVKFADAEFGKVTHFQHQIDPEYDEEQPSEGDGSATEPAKEEEDDPDKGTLVIYGSVNNDANCPYQLVLRKWGDRWEQIVEKSPNMLPKSFDEYIKMIDLGKAL